MFGVDCTDAAIVRRSCEGYSKNEDRNVVLMRGGVTQSCWGCGEPFGPFWVRNQRKGGVGKG